MHSHRPPHRLACPGFADHRPGGHRHGWTTCPFCLACALIAALLAWGERSAAQGRSHAPLEVVASILPLADFVREVGGARVRVTTLVKPGQNPHAFSLRPSQVTALHRAHLLVLNGLGLEFWADTVVGSLDSTRIRVLRLGENLDFESSARANADEDDPGRHEEGEDDEHEHGAIDPHAWLDPILAIAMVRQIQDALGEAMPEHGAEFHERAERYVGELEALDRAYRDTLQPVKQRTFIAFHSGYGHLAARYGLEEVAILRGIGDAEPSPARIAEVIRTARRLKARAIFAEPQYPLRAARLIADEAGAGLAVLDGLGQRDGATYLELMRENLKQLAAALR